VIWRKTIHTRTKRDKRGFGGGVAWSGGKLYVSSGFRFVAQVDPASGEVGWRRETASPIHGAPIVTSGRVFVISTDNELLTFDTATGSPGWTYQALVEPARILASSSPAAAGDTVIGAFASGEVVALRAANGNDLWNTTLAKASRTSALSEIRDVAGRPVVYEGDIYAASHSGVFAATDLRSGQSRWSLPVASISSPWPAGDVVYIVSQAGEVICASRSKGEVYWIRDLNEGEGVKRGNFFGMGRMEDKGGRTLWAGPVLASDRLILASSDGRAVALNAKTGEIIKTIDVGAPVLIAPIAAGGMVYLVTDDAQLVAIR
jgi:outer membrane protein assembly factor BamB